MGLFLKNKITLIISICQQYIATKKKYICIFFLGIILAFSYSLLGFSSHTTSTAASIPKLESSSNFFSTNKENLISSKRKKSNNNLALIESSGLEIYNDSLVNGWIDYGWAERNYYNTKVKYSGNSAISITAKAYEGIYLHHAAFNTSNYSELNFWIHGGNSGQQSLLVGATLNGKEQTLYELPPLAASRWKQITIPLSTLGVDKKVNFDGIFIKDRSGTSSSTYYLDNIYLTKATIPNAVDIVVNTSNVRRTVDDRLFGLNTGAWASSFTSPENVEILKEIDNKVLRFPGGSLSDIYHWSTSQTIENGKVSTQPLSFDAFAIEALRAGNQAFITVNYGSDTPDEAAKWVRYSNQTQKYDLKYWEIGNEVYGEWEYDTNSRPHDPYTYAVRAKEYITKMKAQDPSIKIGVVVTGEEDSYANYSDRSVTNFRTGQTYHGWTPVLLSTLKNLNVIPDFVIYHKYINAPWQENDATLLQSASSWTVDINNIRQMLTDYLGSDSSQVEIVATEHNSTWEPPTGKQMTSIVNGLFFADSIGQAMQTELNALVWWLLRSTPETDGNLDPSLYGWRQHGGYGIISHEHTNFVKYPTFYTAKLISKFARGGDEIVEAKSNCALVSAYAAKKADDRLSLLIINKSPDNSIKTNINIADYIPSGNAEVYSYGIAQDLAAKTLSGSPDIEQDEISNLGSSFAIEIKPYTAKVIVLNKKTSRTTNYL